ncbi:TetR family transcriptional regulator [Caulobacter flavus]|uniref:TetR family transcriptional regulator n=1 Tax=Caulobacter flavus TaxID=1679497 RepID=A0A2N5CUT8_9CAUL|nr:TetR/AcrR family transcriptional regulator [Caulobacter flavus]AYV45030.1 TetR family transcriptional regulator [Caulobacter flavus]PLR17298.1 TetR family transcriptional regulator [Caulobacter flavus]
MNTTAYNRPKQPEQVRRALLEAAVALAEEQGLGGITVQAVADRAGVTKGGLFHHFANKQALIDAVFDFMLEQMEAVLDRLMADDAEQGCFTRAYVISTFECCDMALSGQALSISMVTDPALRRRWRDWVDARLARHADTDSDPRLNVVRLAADGYWFARVLHDGDPGPETPEALQARLIAMTREG